MELPTTLLHHAAPGHPHHDWLIVDPTTRGGPGARLWTARVGPHWRDWATLGRVELTILPAHRMKYLTWEGPLSDGRGHVRTAGRGHVVAHLWTPRRIELTLSTGESAIDCSLHFHSSTGFATVLNQPAAF